MEEWKPIEEYNGLYEVSNLGRVRKVETGRIFTPKPSKKNGYVYITICAPGKKAKQHAIHRLVALSFIPNPDNKPFVNHINENRADNNVTNLEWVTGEENANHGTKPTRAAQVQGHPINEYDEKGHYLRTWKDGISADRVYGLSKSCITKAAKNKSSCCGHFFRIYDGTTQDLPAEEIRPVHFRRRHIPDELLIPDNLLYKPIEETVYDIFNRYKICPADSNVRIKDMNFIFSYIDKLREELENVSRMV